jgi:protein-disulfide isomerase
MESSQSEHYFTAHTSARLTFVIGIVIGMSIMTLGGLGFFVYIFSGGEIHSYAIAPLDTDSVILTEPIKTVATDDEIELAEPDANRTFGAQADYQTTLVYYADYECLFCKKFFPQVLSVVNSHADSVRLIMKHYPLVQIHPHSKAAAVAAYCAADQGKLLEYSEQLYDHQSDFDQDGLLLDVAKQLNLDADQFEACRNGDVATTAIEADAQEAIRLGIQTQPNLLIIRDNGEQQIIDGYVNQSYLESTLGF